MNSVATSIFVDYNKLSGNETLKIYALNNLLIDEFNIKNFILSENRFQYFPTSIFDICPKYLRELELNIAKEIEFHGHNLKNKDDLLVSRVYYEEIEPRKIFEQIMFELKTYFMMKQLDKKIED